MYPHELELDDNVEVIDVREPGEYQAGAIEGSRLMPLATLPARIQDLPKDKKIVLVCKSGARSYQATLFLKHQGWEAENLEGGLKAWSKAGLPLTTPQGEAGRLA